MVYVDYEYYISRYLLGKEPAVPESDFAFWEKQASKEIDRYAYGRLKADSSLVSDDVKDCCCAITELLYRAHTLSEQAAAQGMTGVMTSYSNDGQSGTFDVSQSVYTESGKKAEIRRLTSLYLGNTGLLYAGVSCLES